MTNEERDKWVLSFRAWMLTRPECIQKLAIEYPYGMYLCTIRGAKQYVVGWNESDCVLVSTCVPWNSAEIKRIAVRESIALSAAALRMGAITEVPRHAA